MSLKKSLFWMSTAQGASFILQLASSIVLARYLTPAETGVFAVALAVTGLISVFQQLSLPALIVREKVLTDAISSTAFTVNALITMLLSAVIALSSFAGEWFLDSAGVRRVLQVLAVTPLFGILSFLPAANLERAGRFKKLALISTLAGIVNAGATITFAMLGHSYMSIAYAQVIGSGFYAVIVMIVGRKHLSYRLGFTAWRRIMTFSMQMLAITGVNTLSLRLSDIMLGRLLGLSALGLFNRAAGINNLLWNNVQFVAGRVVLVDYAQLVRRGEGLRVRYLQTMAVITATLWPAFAGLAVIADPLVRTVYGERWAPAVVPFVLLAVSSMIRVCFTMTAEVFTATDNLAAQTRIEVARAIFSVAVFVAACLVSIEAAAASRILAALFALWLYRPHLHRMTGTRAGDYTPIYAVSALLTLLAVGPAAIGLAMGMGEAYPATYMIGSIAVGGVAWLAGLFALKHPLAHEIAATLGPRLPLFGRAHAPR